MPDISLSGPRYKLPVSTAELNRRLAAVQSALRTADLDGCIMQTTSLIFDGVIRYLVDQPTHFYGNTLFVPTEGKMTLINHGSVCSSAPVPDRIRNVEHYMTLPYCQVFECTNGMTGKAVAQEIRALGWKRVGYVFPQLISADTMDTLRTLTDDLVLVDFSRQFSRVRAIKSEEEWELIDKTLRVHDKIMSCVPALLRPGRMEYEVLADLEARARYLGCDYNGNVAVGSAKPGYNANFQKVYTANRRIEKGDNIIVLIEVSGPGGFYAELSRIFTLGKANKSLVHLYNIAKGCQEAVAEVCQPGITGREVSEVFIKYVTERGINGDMRFGGHSQGYDMMESPAICPSEDMSIEEGMYFVIHPELTLGNEFAIACDNYRVYPDGAHRVTKFEQKIFELDI